MLGVDIVNIQEIKNVYEKHAEAFLEKILTPGEIKALLRTPPRTLPRTLGFYFAAKEAIFKACSEDRLAWKDIVLSDITTQTCRIRILKPGFRKKLSLAFSFTSEIVIALAVVTKSDV